MVVLVVLVAAAVTLGFWLAASGDVLGALMLAAGVLVFCCPAATCLAVPALVVRADERALLLGLALDGPTTWARLGRADTVVVRRPEDPLRPTVLSAFRELDALGLRTVLVIDETPAADQFDHETGTAVLAGGEATDLWTAVDAVRFGRRVRRLVEQNLLLAATVTVVAVPLAAAGRLDLFVAVVASVAAALLVVVNTYRIRRFRLRRPPAHRSRGRTR